MKKSQAAIEFLMTYGWALLAVLVAIGALTYFGILDVSKLLPQRCQFGQETPCMEFSIKQNEVVLQLKNAASEVINITSIEWKKADEGVWHTCANNPPSVRLLIEEKTEITCQHNLNLREGDRAKLKFKIKWNNDNPMFNHTGFGEVYGNVEG